MKFSFRWYGPDDPVTLKNIKQIPGMRGIVTALHHIPVGAVWPLREIQKRKDIIENSGLEWAVTESVNVHEEIKLGSVQKDRYIRSYIETLENLAQCGIPVVCYNFMPVFDWTRTELFHRLPDHSSTMFYDHNKIKNKDPEEFIREIESQTGNREMPGWEKDRLGNIRELFRRYQDITLDLLFKNFRSFIRAVAPHAERLNIRLTLHPDDPPWPIFGLPRIVVNQEALERILSFSDSPAHGLTLCSGSLGASPENDIPALIRKFSSRIHFAHIRNLRRRDDGTFYESSHLSEEGSLDLYEIMRAYRDIGFQGWIRPDHGRMIWDEEGRAGYGLYDRALGAAYLQGIREALEKGKKQDLQDLQDFEKT